MHDTPSAGRGPLYVIQPDLPPLEDFVTLLENLGQQIPRQRRPLPPAAGRALCAYLGVDGVSLFNNGTAALLTALQALGIEGEVVTTPYSFVATSHALLWNGLQPAFADIDPVSFNLDPDRIEAAITPRTTAIMPCTARATLATPSASTPSRANTA